MAEAPAHTSRKPTIRGGFVVHRRGDSTGRIMTPPHRQMFEHASLEEARAEAARLAAKFNREFVVFQEVGAVLPPVAEAAQSGEAA